MNAPSQHPRIESRGTAFGLAIASEVPLPELDASSRPASTADVVISLDDLGRDEDPPVGTRRLGSDHYRIDFEAASVSICDGRSIRVDPAPDVPAEIIRHVLLGPSIHHLLHQRGRFVLHASTVVIDETAVAFLGASGVGKTTTAAGCLLAGHGVVSDDVAAVEFVNGAPVVRSGYPCLKLAEGFVERFDLPVGPPLDPSTARDRHFHPLERAQPDGQIPLARIYRLEDGESVDIDRLEPAEAVTALSTNTYTAGLHSDASEAASTFERAGRLCQQVPVARLERPRRFDALSGLVRAVEADLR